LKRKRGKILKSHPDVTFLNISSPWDFPRKLYHNHPF
jgi:hypothetical protein